MDTNLDDSLNLDNAMVEFEHSEDTVVNQADISLDASSHEESIPMEYENIEEQPILMDTGNEEIIDFMGDQISLQEYGSQENQARIDNTNIMSEANIITTESGDMIEIQSDQTLSVPASGLITPEMLYPNIKPQIISVQAGVKIGPRPIGRPKSVVATAPLRQVAIAPKPPKIVQGTVQKINLGPGKQYAIAPKPLKTAVKPTLITLGSARKQVVVMPPSQKIKLMSALPPNLRVLSSAGDAQAQLIQNVTTSQAQGNKLMKVVVQGSQADVNQPAVITKIVSVSSGGGAPRLVSVNKPLSIGNNKVVISSPSKTGGIKYATKPQVLTLKPTSSASLVSTAATSATQGAITKKVVLSATPGGQNVIKLTAASKTGHVPKVTAGQRTQLHQINVPGKGIQYIRLVTNPTAVSAAPSVPAPSPSIAPSPAPGTPLPAPAPAAAQNKTFVLSDGKGNLIHMTAEKVSHQPPPLVRATQHNKGSKPPHKLVRLAPLSSKLGQAAVSRGGQSLLAPLSPMTSAQPSRVTEDLEAGGGSHPEEHSQQADPGGPLQQCVQEEPQDSKAALRALIADTVGFDHSSEDNSQHSQSQLDTTEVEVEFDRRQSNEFEDSSSSMERNNDHPLIVIPPFMKQEIMPVEQNHYDSNQLSSGGLINVEVGMNGPYDYQSALLSERADQPSPDPDMVPPELGLRPRKACNCTKSQCLKLYCDCFANGEFCNRCNCNNCHNNLENEELRQKAIRGCLDRNPNAFRACSTCETKQHSSRNIGQEMKQEWTSHTNRTVSKYNYYWRPKIGKAKVSGADHFRRHNKGCNCKRSGCLKNYCECYEAKIACTNICKCVGCRNVEESIERARRRDAPRAGLLAHQPAPTRAAARPPLLAPVKQPCSFMTSEVIEAVCQCLIAAAVESEAGGEAGAGAGAAGAEHDPIRDVIEEFARCLQDIISASHHPPRELSEMQA